MTITKAGTISKKITKLKSKKKYYVRTRTYKTVSDKKDYSAWSKSKAVKTKYKKALRGLKESDFKTIRAAFVADL